MRWLLPRWRCGARCRRPAAATTTRSPRRRRRRPRRRRTSRSSPPGTPLGDIQEKGEIAIGVKYDVPPFGFKNPQTRRGRGLRRRPRQGDRRQARRQAEVHRGDLRQPHPVPAGRHGRPDPLDDDDQRGARRRDRLLRPVLHRPGPDPVKKDNARSRASTTWPARTSAPRSARPTRRRSRSRRPRPSSSSSTPTRSASSLIQNGSVDADLHRRRDPHRHDHPGRHAQAGRATSSRRSPTAPASRRATRSSRTSSTRRLKEYKADGRWTGDLREVGRPVHGQGARSRRR